MPNWCATRASTRGIAVSAGEAIPKSIKQAILLVGSTSAGLPAVLCICCWLVLMLTQMLAFMLASEELTDLSTLDE